MSHSKYVNKGLILEYMVLWFRAYFQLVYLPFEDLFFIDLCIVYVHVLLKLRGFHDKLTTFNVSVVSKAAALTTFPYQYRSLSIHTVCKSCKMVPEFRL